ncbi:MAG: repeat-containing protein [Deltaproteobacteria bacterium]|nr:repeat-containing protein [Deltaproteobacteria bacterium]
MRLSHIVTGALLLAPTLAVAEPVHSVKPSGSAAMYDFVTTSRDELQFARQVLPPTTGPTTTSALAQSRIVYLNKNGVTLSPGNNDSRTNRSTIADQLTTIAPWSVSATTWSATVACMKNMFASFGATVVDVDPGNVPHIEAVFGGSPTQLGMPNNVAGVSPFTTDCSIIENSIVFTFTDVIPANAQLACEIMAQEVAHSYGLDHELLASDPMTYLPFNSNRTFKNQAVSCGEDVTRPCGINGSTCRANQNSVALLTERLGPAGVGGDTIRPDVGITSPSNNATVPPGFSIEFTATDNIAVTMATLFVDDQPAGTVSAAPFTFVTSATLPEGLHTFRIEATDGANVNSQEITVTLAKGAQPPGGGSGSGSGGGGGGGGNFDGGDISGGCSTAGSTGGSFLVFALIGLVGLVRRRR